MESDITKLIFLVAPLVALNGYYSLYGNSKPIQAARLSFFRVAIPNLGLILASYYLPQNIVFVYIILLAVGIFISGFFASKINIVKYFFGPNRSFMKCFYLKYYKVGLYQLSTPYLALGIVSIAEGFYEIGVIGLMYPVIKSYDVFKGGIRIVNQAFFKELQFDDVGLRVDKVGVVMAFFSYPDRVFSRGCP